MWWIPHAITKLQWIYIYSVKVVRLMCGACLGNLVQRGMERGPHACSNSNFTPIQQLQHHGLDCWWCMDPSHSEYKMLESDSKLSWAESHHRNLTWPSRAIFHFFFFLGLILCSLKSYPFCRNSKTLFGTKPPSTFFNLNLFKLGTLILEWCLGQRNGEEKGESGGNG